MCETFVMELQLQQCSSPFIMAFISSNECGVFYCQFNSKSKKSTKLDNLELPSELPEQLHVAFYHNQLLNHGRVQGGPLGGHDVASHAEHHLIRCNFIRNHACWRTSFGRVN